MINRTPSCDKIYDTFLKLWYAEHLILTQWWMGLCMPDSVVGKCFWAQCSWKSSPHLKSCPCFKHGDHSPHMGCCCIMELSWATFGNCVLISTWQLTKQLVTPLWGSPLEEATCMGRLIYNKVLMALLYPLGHDEKYKWPIILFSLVRYLTHCCILSSLGSGMYQSFGLESDLQTSPDIGSKTDSGWYDGDICLVLKLIWKWYKGWYYLSSIPPSGSNWHCLKTC